MQSNILSQIFNKHPRDAFLLSAYLFCHDNISKNEGK